MSCRPRIVAEYEVESSLSVAYVETVLVECEYYETRLKVLE
jgi:hypothetical protein